MYYIFTLPLKKAIVNERLNSRLYFTLQSSAGSTLIAHIANAAIGAADHVISVVKRERSVFVSGLTTLKIDRTCGTSDRTIVC